MPELTVRQQLIALLLQAPRSSRDLAVLVGLSEREVESHLTHIVRSLARDRARRFQLEPSRCRDCGFIFRERTRLTKPSRCPKCRGESVTPPVYHILSGP